MLKLHGSTKPVSMTAGGVIGIGYALPPDAGRESAESASRIARAVQSKGQLHLARVWRNLIPGTTE